MPEHRNLSGVTAERRPNVTRHIQMVPAHSATIKWSKHAVKRGDGVQGGHMTCFPLPSRLTSIVLSSEPTLFLRPRLPVSQSDQARG